MNPPLLELRGVGKRFGLLVVADELDLVLRTGETLGIVGPNGAGKSTLFAMISGELKPDGGTVHIDGREITQLAAHERTVAGIGRTFQIPRPFEGMTVFENVLLFATAGGGLRGTAAIVRAAETLDRTGLGARANKRAGELGLLQRKRLEVARALASGPRVLLLDEVAGGLTDPEVAVFLDLVEEIKEQGLAIVWIEHVVHALLAAVDRLACLAGGRLIADGDPHEVLRDQAVRDLYVGHAVTTEEDLV
ncbi:ABC transporter ATP-binding protein [Pseudonocardia sp. GCM10023141]|uniref:ABC transporter ATP-binding protein n=1 Tax=Pseudonocardia sp. GCM10023141 TaxID=3252653 RepID=UPI00361E5278